jgi:hypothetical protein
VLACPFGWFLMRGRPLSVVAVVAQTEAASTAESQPPEDPQTSRFTWTIANFTRLSGKKHYSDVFVVGGFKWLALGLFTYFYTSCSCRMSCLGNIGGFDDAGVFLFSPRGITWSTCPCTWMLPTRPTYHMVGAALLSLAWLL